MKKDYLEYKGFIGTVHFSTEDEMFFGKIEGIPDLISFEGMSVKELKKAFQEAVNSYIELCKEHNKPVVKSLKGTFNIRINPELHRRAYNISSARGISLNQLVQKAIEKELSE